MHIKLKLSESFKKKLEKTEHKSLTSVLKGVEKEWSTDRETPSMEQTILSQARTALLSQQRGPGGIPRSDHRVPLQPQH